MLDLVTTQHRARARTGIDGAPRFRMVNYKVECVMEVGEMLKQRGHSSARGLVTALSRLKIVFTLSTAGYCAIHLLAAHGFSIYVFASALLFGAAAVATVAWLSAWFDTSSST